MMRLRLDTRAALAALLLLVLAWAGPAAAQGAGGQAFDHLRTGYPLTGVHNTTACEGCHVGGVFKGTPRNCDSCHVAGSRWARGNTVKPATHLPTQQACDNCHTTRTFTGAKMDHSGVAAGSCATCHNGVQASGKPAGHVATTASCDTCHRSAAWSPVARFDHSAFNAGTNCASCHNGSTAIGKSATHIPAAGTNCVACHTTSVWKPSTFNHTQVSVANQCASCHSGAYPPADGKSAAHTPYQSVGTIASANCDTCHKAGYTAWTPAKLHTSVTVVAQCSNCHLAAKPSTAIHNGQAQCESCHKSSTSWTANVSVDHSGFTAATNCASCHNGSAATGKSATHIPFGATNCIACHTTSVWKPSTFNHTQVSVANQCASCHSGAFPPADGKPATHTPYQTVATMASANCDTCHKAGYAAWTPAKLHTSVTVVAQCASCHLPVRPNTAIHSGQTQCENCHKSTSSWTAGTSVDHSTFTAATNCASCHNGSAATGKPATHIPVGATNCISCHTTSVWKPSTFNHTQVSVANQCATCHSGAYPPADGKPATHIPYQTVAMIASANCDTCHKAGYSAWTPAKLHTSVTVVAQCSNCHLSVRPNTAIHSGQTQCENCHKSTSSWTAGTSVDHSTFTAATNCTTCHNGGAATGKPATHIPVGATNCIACHTTSLWKPSTFNHTQVSVANQCATCHSGAYPPADGKPATHIPYQTVATIATANCDTCHKAGYSAWTPAKLHTSVTVVAQCSNCHLSVRPNTAIHSGQTQCENCHKSTTSWTAGVGVDHSTFTAATNCTSCHNGSTATGKPATHIPVAATNCFACHTTTAWKPTKWNHTQVPVTDCASCHSGAYPPADGKPAGHIPYATIAGLSAANCSTCHKGGYASWAGGKLHAYATVGGQCKTCHSGSYVSQGALAKPANHIPEAQLLNGSAMECNACHNSATSWSSQRMNHNASQGSGAGWCKACHASGTNYLGDMERKSLTHERSNPVPTDCSTSGCHRPLGSRGSPYSSWD